jgi:hypothetical protein
MSLIEIIIYYFLLGTGRYFPLLPPYYNIDFAANFNKLKSNNDIAYFVVRDSIAVGYLITILVSNLARL